MISRTWITCLTCTKPITARIQVGHQLEQPINFPCPNCGTEVRLTLILDEPPRVKIRWEENAEAGTQEGAIINIGAGFTIAKDKLHEDLYFPSFDAPRPNLDEYDIPEGLHGSLLLDTTIALGALPRAAEHWRTIQRALRFNRTEQKANLDAQLVVRSSNNITDMVYNSHGFFATLNGGNHGGKDKTCGAGVDGGSKEDAEGVVQIENGTGARD